MGPDSRAISRPIEEIGRGGLDIEDKGNIEDYLYVNVEDQYTGKINITQPQIIGSIINDSQLPNNTVPR